MLPEMTLAEGLEHLNHFDIVRTETKSFQNQPEIVSFESIEGFFGIWRSLCKLSAAWRVFINPVWS